ncbi:MAG: hypothetical protein LBF22_10865 [Deltaproteobacteria bacterium]|jgi:flagellar basal body-associated protein FliL|nr:hypothetical protein [Deltaproteobacteria bacterium]
MEISTFLIVIICFPLTLLFVAFLIICLKFFRSKAQDQEISETLAKAQELNQNLEVLEKRLTNLESILLEDTFGDSPQPEARATQIKVERT